MTNPTIIMEPLESTYRNTTLDDNVINFVSTRFRGATTRLNTDSSKGSINYGLSSHRSSIELGSGAEQNQLAFAS
jgi:hypothetical protein